MTEIRAEITANVWLVNVEAGQAVDAAAELIVLESMKMELPVAAPGAGTINKVHVAVGDHVTEGDLLVTFD